MFKYMLFITLLLPAGWHAMAQQPQLLILGTAHLNNPNRDMNNMVVDDVLTPKRQAEIADIVDHVARFRPTHVGLECSPSQQSAYDQRYAEYRAGKYALSRNEREQIGMRLAAKLNLARVDCVDYQAGPPGPDADYDFMTFGQAHQDLMPLMQKMELAGKSARTEDTAFLQSHPLLEWYQRENQLARLKEGNKVYMRYIVPLADAGVHPGANWVGGWHARNMIIVDNLRRLAKPGDRVFTIFGSGHAYLLNEFALESAAFDVVDTESYLQ